MSIDNPSSDKTVAELPERVFHEELTCNLIGALKVRDADDDEYELNTRAEAEALLSDAWRENASDIHIDPFDNGICIRMRISGVVLNAMTLDSDHGLRLINQFKTLANINPVHLLVPEDGRFDFLLGDQRLDFRLTCTPCIEGEKLTIRTLVQDRIQLQMHEIGLQDEDMENIDDWLGKIRGMLLVSGPTGSGKTTTVYALLHKLKIQDYNIMTIEDPVEYKVRGINQVQVNREQGLDFAQGVRALLRLDPDYILLGEVRESPSVRAAFDAAVSGHALMTTLHSHDAVSALTVLRNYGLDSREISANVEIIISQRLVRKLCTSCREQRTPKEEDKRWLRSLGIEPPDQAWYPTGCQTCKHVGYLGRIGIFEVWRITQEDYSIILEDADERTLREHLARRGHHFLLDDALAKAAKGVTSLAQLRPVGGFGPLGMTSKARAAA